MADIVNFRTSQTERYASQLAAQAEGAKRAEQGPGSSRPQPRPAPAERPEQPQQSLLRTLVPSAPTGGEMGAAVTGAGRAVAGGIGSAADWLLSQAGPGGNAAAYLLGSSVMPSLDATLAQASGPKPGGGMETAALAANDQGMLGLLDSLAGGQAQVRALAGGASPEDAAEAGSLAQDKVNFNLAESRNDNRLAAISGDILGSFVPGGPLFKGGVYLAGGRQSLGAGFAAFGQTTAYQLNSDGSLSGSLKSGAGAGVLGLFGDSLLRVGGGIVSTVAGRTSNVFRTQVGDEIYQAMRAKAAQNGQELTLPQAIALVDGMGPEQVIADLYPSLQRHLVAGMRSPNEEVQQRMLGLLRTRSSLAGPYRESMLKAISGDDLMTPTQHAAHIDAQYKALRPRYDQLFNDMDAAQWATPIATVRASVRKLMDETTTGAGDDLATLRSLIADVRPANRVNTAANRANTDLSFREVNDLRKGVQNEIHRRLRSNNSAATTDVAPIKNLQNASNYLRDVLSTNDQFRTLQATYGDISDTRNAYEFGRSVITRANLDGADASIFLSGDINDASVQALARGSRYTMFASARDAANPASALKDGRLDTLRAVLGDEAVTRMETTTGSLIARDRTRQSLIEGSEAGIETPTTAFRAQTVADSFMAPKVLTGGAAGVGPLAATRRLVQRGFGDNPTMYPNEISNSARIRADAATSRDGAGAALAALQRAGNTADVRGTAVTGLSSLAGEAVSGSESVDATMSSIQEFLASLPSFTQ
jgi:hypothetical protein